MDFDKKRTSERGERHRDDYLKRHRDKIMDDIKERKRRALATDEKNTAGPKGFVTDEGSVENKLKQSTIGLVKLEEFQRIKGELEESRQREAAKTLVKKNDKKTKKSKRSKTQNANVLSFDDDTTNNDITKPRKVGKNPSVDTSFLPDKEREANEATQREALRQEWLQQQEKIKRDEIKITYSYWDGSGHRKQVTCKKGDTIAHFLDKCRQQIPELRGSSVDSLLYVKEDLIIPHHYSFYEFIVNKARGKSGPLFSFDVRDDVRIASDARVEKTDSHAGKVCERTWYERNKHIFPANRWEIFDPEKEYGSYTIKDSGKHKK